MIQPIKKSARGLCVNGESLEVALNADNWGHMCMWVGGDPQYALGNTIRQSGHLQEYFS